MDIIALHSFDDLNRLQKRFAVAVEPDPAVAATVRDIIDAVRSRGDEALIDFTRRYDGVELSADKLLVPEDERQAAMDQVPEPLLQALETAAQRIRRFHEKQLRSDWQIVQSDRRLTERVLPLERVGLYIPGGRACYPSTVLMCAVPAGVAGVQEMVMATPPDEKGKVPAVLLAAANIAGVHRVFRVGGAQAVAALAFGTAHIPRVDKVVGPGNAYVAEAKRQLFGIIGIDSIAGPTELAVWFDDSVDPLWVVQDVFAQMEHDPMTRTLLVSNERAALQRVAEIMQQELPQKPRSAVLEKAQKNCLYVHAATPELACAAINAFAPEHLQLLHRDATSWLHAIRNAAAVFVGPWTPAVLGDYIAGPNHTLPTAGAARYASALGVDDFLKTQHIVQYGRQAFLRDSRLVEILAESEALFNHALSVAVRRGHEA